MTARRFEWDDADSLKKESFFDSSPVQSNKTPDTSEGATNNPSNVIDAENPLDGLNKVSELLDETKDNLLDVAKLSLSGVESMLDQIKSSIGEIDTDFSFPSNFASTMINSISNYSSGFMDKLNVYLDDVSDYIKDCGGTIQDFKGGSLDLNVVILAGIELVYCSSSKGNATVVATYMDTLTSDGIKKLVVKSVIERSLEENEPAVTLEMIDYIDESDLVAAIPDLPFRILNAPSPEASTIKLTPPTIVYPSTVTNTSGVKSVTEIIDSTGKTTVTKTTDKIGTKIVTEKIDPENPVRKVTPVVQKVTKTDIDIIRELQPIVNDIYTDWGGQCVVNSFDTHVTQIDREKILDTLDKVLDVTLVEETEIPVIKDIQIVKCILGEEKKVLKTQEEILELEEAGLPVPLC